MPCPTCDHTMSRLGCQYSECQGSWACPRCGTLKIGHDDGHVDVIVPSLVERCRQFEQYVRDDTFWHQLGVAESINTPENRPHARPH